MAWRQALSKWGVAGIAAGAVSAGGVAWCEADPRSLYDPEALERGAKSLREIQKSPHAKKVWIVAVSTLTTCLVCLTLTMFDPVGL